MAEAIQFVEQLAELGAAASLVVLTWGLAAAGAAFAFYAVSALLSGDW